MDPTLIDDLVDKLSRLLPADLNAIQQDLRKNFRGVLQATFAKMDLITREEFDIQKNVLLRTRAKLDALEQQLQALEKKSTTL